MPARELKILRQRPRCVEGQYEILKGLACTPKLRPRPPTRPAGRAFITPRVSMPPMSLSMRRPLSTPLLPRGPKAPRKTKTTHNVTLSPHTAPAPRETGVLKLRTPQTPLRTPHTPAPTMRAPTPQPLLMRKPTPHTLATIKVTTLIPPTRKHAPPHERQLRTGRPGQLTPPKPLLALRRRASFPYLNRLFKDKKVFDPQGQTA